MLIPAPAVFDQKINVFGGGFVMLVAAKQGAVAIPGEEGIFGLLDDLWLEVQVGGEIKGPEELQVEVKAVFQGFAGL